MRKTTFLFFSLLVIAFSMSSCLNGFDSQTTPVMDFGMVYVNPQFSNDTLIGAQDTLKSYYDEELGCPRLDTIQLGDTIMFGAVFYSNMNRLVNIHATFDTTRVDLWFGIDIEKKEFKAAFKEDSDPTKGVLNFNPICNMLTFPIYIVPEEAGSHRVKVTVVSDSEYSTNDASFVLPVKN